MITAEALDQELAALLGLEQWALRNPYPIYAGLRESSPVHVHGSTVFLTKYDDVVAALKDHSRLLNTEVGSRIDSIYAAIPPQDAVQLDGIRAYQQRQMVRLDEPDHAGNREIAQLSFTPRLITGMREVVHRIVDELLEQIEGDPVQDFVEVFAHRLPMLVIFEMLRIPEDKRSSVRGWSEDITRFRASPTDRACLQKAYSAHVEFSGLVREVLALNRGLEAHTNLMASLLGALDSGAISEFDLVAMVMMILFAGHETTTNLLGNGLLALMRHRDQWQAIGEDPALVPAAVEECLRHDAPVQFVLRSVAEDMNLRGITIPKGHSIAVVVGAANRDPALTPEPDRFDIHRLNARHVTFGFGIHFCIGAVLARMEGQVAFAALSSKFPELELAAADEIMFKPSAALRGPDSLPVRFGPRMKP